MSDESKQPKLPTLNMQKICTETNLALSAQRTHSTHLDTDLAVGDLDEERHVGRHDLVLDEVDEAREAGHGEREVEIGQDGAQEAELARPRHSGLDPRTQLEAQLHSRLLRLRQVAVVLLFA